MGLVFNAAMALVLRRVASALTLALVSSCFSPLGNGSDSDPASDTGSSVGEASTAAETGSTSPPTGEGPTTEASSGSSAPTGSVDTDTGSSTTAPESCIDGVQGGDETDLDCGGSCAPCEADQGCQDNGDCVSMACLAGACVGTPECLDASSCGSAACMQATCVDFVCGEAPADGMACDDGQVCTQDESCEAGMCVGSTPKPIALVDLPEDPSLGLYFDGVAQADNTGAQVGHAGDFNGDGVPDVFVATLKGMAPGPKIYVLYGGDTLAKATLAGVLNGEGGVVIDAAGSPTVSVAAGGDLDGDGRDDLVMGSSINVNTTRGGAYVVFGREESDPIKLSTMKEKVALITGPEVGPATGFGTAVASLGDVNDDGFDDFAVTAPAYRVDDEAVGATFVITGGLLTSDKAETYVGKGRGYLITGPKLALSLGVSVAGIGDVNKDGRRDLAIGQTNWNMTRGRVFVVYTAASLTPVQLTDAMAPNSGLIVSGESLPALSGFGTRIAGVGDFNKDTVPDYMITTSGSGRKAMVVYGAAGGTKINAKTLVADGTGTEISTLDPEPFTIGGGYDVDGDLIDDVVVGSPDAGMSGLAYVVFGSKTPTTHTVVDLFAGKGGYAIAGPGTLGNTGSAVAIIPSIDGDQSAEVLIGAQGYDVAPMNNEGRAYIVYGGACEG